MSIFDDSIFTKELEETAKMFGKTRREVYSPRFRSVIWRNDLINNTFTKVIPELEKGNIVILDRYSLCNRVYSNLEKEGFSHLDKMLTILPEPDLGIFLDADVEIAMKRIQQRGKEIAPYETKQKLTELREKYLQEISKENYEIKTVDANLSKEKVTNQTMKYILELLNEKIRKEKNKLERDI